MKQRGTVTLLALSLGFAGCLGTVGEVDSPWRPGGARPGDAPREGVSSFTCDEDARPDELPLRRLSGAELRRTLHDLIAQTADGATAQAAMGDVADTLARLPGDSLDEHIVSGDTHGPARYRRLVQTVSQAHVDAYYDVAVAVGTALSRDDARLGALMGACAVDSDPGNDAACLDAFVDRFASAAFRAPLDPEERSFLRHEAYIDGDAVSPVGVGELVAVILMAPRFLYHFELGEPGGDTVVALHGHELAARLSYHLWGSMPDSELTAAAAAGELETEEGYAAQVERLLADPRARERLAEFVGQWLGISELGRLDQGAGIPQYDAFYGPYTPSGSLHRDMLEELSDFAAHTVFEEEGTLEDLFTSTAAFPRTDELGELYGVDRWREGQPPVALPAAERAGLLTRAAALAIPSVNPHPILRGVRLRRHVICDTLGEPPADVVFPDTHPAMSSRDLADELTSSPSCQGCHTAINDLGFAFGHYDALGRYIEAERIFDEQGELVLEPAVDAGATPRISPRDDAVVEDGIELSAMLGRSAKVEACFTRQYFRFTHRRLEHIERDGCALERMRQTLAEGGSVLDLMRASALDPEFRTRRVAEGE